MPTWFLICLIIWLFTQELRKWITTLGFALGRRPFALNSTDEEEELPYYIRTLYS